MVDIIILIIGFIAVLVLIVFVVITTWIICRKYSNKDTTNNTRIEEIHCDDIKTTAITISQHHINKRNAYSHARNRSQSDPDILFDSVVTLAIESPCKSHRSPESSKSAISESTESQNTDDDIEEEETISPLSSTQC